jgi:hypothetical protein
VVRCSGGHAHFFDRYDRLLFSLPSVAPFRREQVAPTGDIICVDGRGACCIYDAAGVRRHKLTTRGTVAAAFLQSEPATAVLLAKRALWFVDAETGDPVKGRIKSRTGFRQVVLHSRGGATIVYTVDGAGRTAVRNASTGKRIPPQG